MPTPQTHRGIEKTLKRIGCLESTLLKKTNVIKYPFFGSLPYLYINFLCYFFDIRMKRRLKIIYKSVYDKMEFLITIVFIISSKLQIRSYVKSIDFVPSFQNSDVHKKCLAKRQRAKGWQHDISDLWSDDHPLSVSYISIDMIFLRTEFYTGLLWVLFLTVQYIFSTHIWIARLK